MKQNKIAYEIVRDSQGYPVELYPINYGEIVGIDSPTDKDLVWGQLIDDKVIQTFTKDEIIFMPSGLGFFQELQKNKD